MNLTNFEKLNASMNSAPNNHVVRLIPRVVIGLILLGLVCLPLLANASNADDGEKSSRRTKSTPATPSNTKTTTDKTTTDKSDDKKSDVKKSDDKSDVKKNDDKKNDDKAQDKADDSDNRLELDDSKPTKNGLRDGAVKLLSGSENDQELTIEAQQKKDQGECPGSEGSKVPTTQNVNDTPLEQEEHPFDAPAAETDESPTAEDGELPPVKKGTSKNLSEKAPTESAAKLEQRINTCLAYYYTHKESLTKRSPWAVMHTILPFGVETDIAAGPRNVNAIGWMCYNGVCKTQRVFQTTSTGFRTNVGPGVQGHEGQFLAVLAQSSVPRNFPLVIGKSRYTVSDLIRYEMVTCKEKSELTFKLIGLSHYLSPKQTWRDERGHTWNLEKLVREELDQPVVGAACGGTHRLMGLSYALMMRKRYEQPINGHWARADVYLNDFVKYAWSLQNPDGSFSTDWFEGRANEPNMERKVQTTGHILEWLIFTLPAEELDDPRIAKSVEFLLSQIYEHRDKDWPIGPRGHSLRAISLYNQRVFGAPTGQLKSHLAQAGYMKDLR